MRPVMATGRRSRPGWRDRQPLHRTVEVGPHSECNVIYSSGTTGLPKGIVHTHGCRYDWGTDLAIALRYRSDCVTVCSLGLYSNISWVAMLSTIVVGGTIVVLESFSAAALVDAIERHGVTHGGFVPVQFQRVLELPGIATRNLSSLQAIMCCGSPLPPPLKRATRDTLACELIELYGLTEGHHHYAGSRGFRRAHRVRRQADPRPAAQARA